MMNRLLYLLRSPSTYPLATFWLIAMVIVPLTVADTIQLNTTLIILTGAALILVVVASHKATVALRVDVEQVHTLVNSQHDDLVARVSQLIDALEVGGVAVPQDPKEGHGE